MGFEIFSQINNVCNIMKQIVLELAKLDEFSYGIFYLKSGHGFGFFKDSKLTCNSLL